MPIVFVLFALGVFMLLYEELKHFRKERKVSLRSLILIWFIVSFVGVALWIPLKWDRYYLPVIPGVVIILGYSIDRILAAFRK
jgi:4-amino-4-deoxy-L-arabinose transferase-like glycosyltransferase